MIRPPFTGIAVDQPVLKKNVMPHVLTGSALISSISMVASGVFGQLGLFGSALAMGSIATLSWHPLGWTLIGLGGLCFLILIGVLIAHRCKVNQTPINKERPDSIDFHRLSEKEKLNYYTNSLQNLEVSPEVIAAFNNNLQASELIEVEVKNSTVFVPSLFYRDWEGNRLSASNIKPNGSGGFTIFTNPEQNEDNTAQEDRLGEILLAIQTVPEEFRSLVAMTLSQSTQNFGTDFLQKKMIDFKLGQNPDTNSLTYEMLTLETRAIFQIPKKIEVSCTKSNPHSILSYTITMEFTPAISCLKLQMLGGQFRPIISQNNKPALLPMMKSIQHITATPGQPPKLTEWEFVRQEVPQPTS